MGDLKISNIEEYAEMVADTVKNIILTNKHSKEIHIDSIDVGCEDTFIEYTVVKHEKVVRKWDVDDRN